MPTGVTEKALAQCSQPLLPNKSNDLIYTVEIQGSSQYLLKQNERIYDGSRNTSVDTYVDVVLFSNVGYIPNNVEYSWPIVVEPNNIVVITTTCLGIAKSGSEDRQFFINGIQKTTWKTKKYKLYCFKNSPLKHTGLQHKFQNHVHRTKSIQYCSVRVISSNTTHNKRASTLSALRAKLPLREGQCYINNNNNI